MLLQFYHKSVKSYIVLREKSPVFMWVKAFRKRQYNLNVRGELTMKEKIVALVIMVFEYSALN